MEPHPCFPEHWHPSALSSSCPQVKCYHKKFRSATRDVIFRLQFHTGAVHDYRLLFGKEDLDGACRGEVLLPPLNLSDALPPIHSLFYLLNYKLA